MKGMAIMEQIVPAIAIPILLVIGMVVFGNFQTSVQNTSIFLAGPTSEALGGGIGNYTATHYPISSATGYTITAITNKSATLTYGTNFTITNYDTGSIRIMGLADANDKVNVTYYYRGGNTWTAASGVATNTYTGFNLGAIIPLVIFAAVILGIIIGSFMYFGGRR